MLADTPSPRGSGATLRVWGRCPRASNGLLPRRTNLVGYVRRDARSNRSSSSDNHANSFYRSQFVTNSLVEDLPDETTLPMGNRPDSLFVSEPRYRTPIVAVALRSPIVIVASGRCHFGDDLLCGSDAETGHFREPLYRILMLTE